MKVAVITPYYEGNDPEWLEQCHRSVQLQDYPCTHIIVGDGHQDKRIDDWQAQHIKLDINHADYGDTPRAIGSLSAIGQGFDAIAYLDADNWYKPNHISSLVKLHQATHAAVCLSGRTIHRADGTLMGKCGETDGENFADTSSLFFTRKAFQLASSWATIDPELHAIGDRVVFHLIKQHKLSLSFTGMDTLAYRTDLPDAYFNRQVPAKDLPSSEKMKEARKAFTYLINKGGPDLRPIRQRNNQANN